MLKNYPKILSASFTATVNSGRRKAITSNHSATHLMHAALRDVLGKHVAQKGSLVNEDVTRFDFSHFTKVTDEELERIEIMVNEKIRENIRLNEQRNVPVAKAMEMGAMALFGEKYGEYVRVITFDPGYSVELCGGTHVQSTGEIGLFKFISESSVAAGVRRVEAITGKAAENLIRQQTKELNEIKLLLKNPNEPLKGIQSLLDEKNALQQQLEQFLTEKASIIREQLKSKAVSLNGMNVICEKIELSSADAIKGLSFDLRNQIDNLVLLLGAEVDGKPHLSLIVSDNLVKEKNINASNLIRNIAKEIQGGGGGQPFYATAGGKNSSGLDAAIKIGNKLVSEL
jgi:alanyl-tRNA synthetase